MRKSTLNQLKEGIDHIVDLIKKNQERREKLIDQLIPLLNPGAQKAIIDDHKESYVLFKQEPPPDKNILKNHLEGLILDFDCNIHRLKESEILAFAEIINKDPDVSFFISDE